ncbi:hypothetical protein HK100_012750 [Physocladia obscura]|uniref:Nudix hydrolase domain-containing protein n=1 Tax=Physocladia obscura TaxID=109957 RepID=A0AAD5T1W3_9FUNG|nr:hypothetical protein HK100_012750 [Physocladia obscura]
MLEQPSIKTGLPLYIDEAARTSREAVGIVRSDVVRLLEEWSGSYGVRGSGDGGTDGNGGYGLGDAGGSGEVALADRAQLVRAALTVHNDGVVLAVASTEAQRTARLEALLVSFRDAADVALLAPSKWRGERYSVWDARGHVALRVERAAAGLLGVRVYGCHLNAYCHLPIPSTSSNDTNPYPSNLLNTHDNMRMWVARRSFSKQTYPGMLDNMVLASSFPPVAGGLPHGLSPTENIIKECAEEANLVFSSLADYERPRPVSVITSFMDSQERGWVPDTEFIFDIKLPPSFVPVCQDGEVHGFELLSIDQVSKHLLNGEFMPESALCVIDFLIRHGFIDPSTEPGYMNIISGIHRPLPFPGPRYNFK